MYVTGWRNGRLKFNLSKCRIVHYGRQDEISPYSMRDGTTRADVKVREEEKDLGVTFDPSLKFSKHVGVVANKGNRIVGLIRRTFAYGTWMKTCFGPCTRR